MGYSVSSALVCHTGLIRGSNEDNFLFSGLSLRQENDGLSKPLVRAGSTERLLTFAVFDGMGGEEYGEAASFTAARESFLTLRGQRDVDQGLLEQAVQSLNAAVFRQGQSLGAASMGTTLVMVCMEGELAWVCNLGDSRIYLLREENLYQLSRDHTDAQALLERGIQRKPRLTQHLGMDPEEILLQPYIAPVALQTGDRWLLCSDGVTDMLSDQEIWEVMSTYQDCEASALALRDQALARGGRDNLTAIVCRVE